VAAVAPLSSSFGRDSVAFAAVCCCAVLSAPALVRRSLHYYGASVTIRRFPPVKGAVPGLRVDRHIVVAVSQASWAQGDLDQIVVAGLLPEARYGGSDSRLSNNYNFIGFFLPLELLWDD